MKNRIHQALIDDFDIATGERPARREPSLPYVTAVRFCRAAVWLALLAGAGACVVKLLTSFSR